MPRLERWSVICSELNPYQAPECQDKVLHGMVYDDETQRFEDGTPIRTSRLIEINTKNNSAKTLNTEYILGDPSEDYLKWLEENNISL